MSDGAQGMQSSLFELRAVLGLVVFAVEARRVLNALDKVTLLSPEVEKTLAREIECHMQWQDLPDTATEALLRIYERLGVLADAAADAD